MTRRKGYRKGGLSMDMKLEDRYEDYLLRAKIMNVAAQLVNDRTYSNEDGAKELVEIVNWIEKNEYEKAHTE